MSSTIDYVNAVGDRYAKAAQEREIELCCPVNYNPDLLKVIPQEIIDLDYGCGDPSPFVKPGDTVLDLGSGGGKLCYIASQLVGKTGHVIGVDYNPTMLDLARRHQSTVAQNIGYDNVSFRCGMIQDLKLDLERLSTEREKITATGVDALIEERSLEQRLTSESPLVANESVDCVVSNCVLNLVRPSDRTQLFEEVFRVLKVGGRAAISDIVSDETVPQHLQDDPNLWSGCISGAWREDEFLAEFAKAGFLGMEIVKRDEKPWQTVEGIEFRSITVVAIKPEPGPCLERNQAVVYRGPFKQVADDDGHVYQRGQRMAVCDKTFRVLQSAPYADSFLPIQPYQDIPLSQAGEFDCSRDVQRHPRETKGLEYNKTLPVADDCCGDGSCC